MTWKKIGNFLLENGVKRLGGFLLNPAGETVDLIADLIGGKLGEDDPEKVYEILRKDKDALVKLKELEMSHETELERLAIQDRANRLAADTARLQSVNQTMQAETQAKWKWSAFWRPLWGVLSAIAFFVQMVGIMIILSILVYKVLAGEVDNISQILTAVSTVLSAIFPMWGIAGAVLGVTAWHRGKMQRAMVEAPGRGLTGPAGKLESIIRKTIDKGK